MNNRPGFTADGKFAPGNKLRLGNPGGSSYTHKVTSAIQSRFPPETVADMMVETWEMAVKQKSSRGMALVLGYILDHTVGKPTQRVKVEEEGMPAWLRVMLDRQTGENERQLIEGEGRVIEIEGEENGGEGAEDIATNT